ncbi:MAG: DUF86 domain-containing protein [Flavobacteriaceae bacterium]|nr:DUF86 domain-containing protein [Flavobacteriaceae bacterium]MCY4266459.1 DUF86 domain-containing protein [Flavobacteriaceae bacterium]MCY4297877.1 DUF86 domain-containing protein [Flavobacteriaceae bacterium]
MDENNPTLERLKTIQSNLEKLFQRTDSYSDYKDFNTNFEIQCITYQFSIFIGNAIKESYEDLKHDAPDFRWEELIQFRDKIAHLWKGLNTQLLWKAVQHDFPLLQTKVLSILETIEQSLEKQ